MELVDIHCHGGGGNAFGDTVDGTLAALAAHQAAGTSRVVASLVTEPLDAMVAKLAVVREAMAQAPALLGVHLEGPFLAPSRKGAHPPHALIDPTPDAVSRLLDAGEGILRQITMAPELPGALDAIARFADAGVVVAVGHTECTAAQATEAFDAGARLVTHAFNAMPPIAGRAPGPLGAALADERVFIEVIADGFHVAPEPLALLFAAAPGRAVLMTDAMAAAASAEGTYMLGELEVTVAGGKAVLTGTDTLAGSTLVLSRALDVCEAAGVPRDVAIEAATATPLRALEACGWMS
ncbi:N-acetylglucosamine-6-phosphate deacetylase [Demequina zhanjiangensis]|uniref:Amidohydrolase family protein n=1 Tax=Demequina zhanjiangensis TaxID=3051659 RepID=A0ABT8FXH8_9MICO|nr:amidohydrolase family protein [Demequina sp. SYSU T00b26]MDN4471614.1 amidohydrolase family protein [Demequina sp. SYSU T00b26]